MLKTFTAKALLAPALAASLALGTMAAPAQADTDDTVRAIAGIAALALIIGAANRNNNNDGASSVTSSNTNQRVYGTVTTAPTWTSKSAAQRRPLPETCIRSVHTERGPRTVYGARCLNSNYIFASFLPDQCRVGVRMTNGKVRPAYATKSLRREGWKVQNGVRYERFADFD